MVQASSSGAESRPVVLISGAVEPRLIPIEMSVIGPLDQRSATLRFEGDITARLIDHWAGSDVTVALPCRLIDGQVRWSVLLHGRLDRGKTRLLSGVDDQVVEVVDRWAALLKNPLAAVWWEVNGQLVVENNRAL